jgi:16S rRNA G966 N2-methylase RsmD
MNNNIQSNNLIEYHNDSILIDTEKLELETFGDKIISYSNYNSSDLENTYANYNLEISGETSTCTISTKSTYNQDLITFSDIIHPSKNYDSYKSIDTVLEGFADDNDSKDNMSEDSNKNVQDYFEDNPWDDAINDNKFYINNKIARVFPILKNSSQYTKLQIDEESFSFITIREIAELISKIICNHLLKYNLNPQKIKIVDYTAGVGGNVLSFSKYFNQVYAIEICKNRSEYLENNINVYGYKNISVINDSAITYQENRLIQDDINAIFIDPPWGGNDYKNIDNLQLKLDDTTIEELISDIFKKYSDHYLKISPATIKNNFIDYNNMNNKLIILKLPKNYDIENLYNHIKKIKYPNFLIYTYLYILNKMLIVVCELCFIIV